MSLFGELFRPRAESTPYKPWDDYWYQSVAGVGSIVGIPVTPTVALQVAAVFACVKVISETLASMPLIVYRRRGDGGKDRATDHPLYQRLHEAPNAWQTSVEFIDDQQGHVALHGACFAEILPGPSGAVEELVPLHPERVTVEQLTNRRLRYQLRESDGQTRTLTQDQVFHVRSRALDFYTGMSTRSQARDAIALARAIDTYASKFFANDASIGLVYEHPTALSDPAFKKLNEQFKTTFGGVGNAHKPKILEGGGKMNRLPMTAAKDAQLTEAQEAAVIQVCRFYRMPPHKVQHLLNATFSNIEHQGIEFVTDTMLPWARRWEARINASLITDSHYFAEFLLDGLLRGDNAARASYYTALFNVGAISQNEIRSRENLNPIDGGDRYYVQGAYVPIDRVDSFLNSKVAAPSVAPPSAMHALPAASARPTNAFARLLGDAAERIARTETREIGQRLAKSGDPSRMTMWLSEFQSRADSYATLAITPLAEAWREETETSVSVDTLVAAIRAGAFVPGSDFAVWSVERAASITTILRTAFGCDDKPLPLAA